MSSDNREYTYDDMVKLKNNIQKIKNKDVLIGIKNIITELNPSHSITKNENGFYLCFHNLSDETYPKISSYIKSYFKSTKTLNSKSDNDSITATDFNTSITFENNSRLKYSNKEKSLIKRKIYDNKLKNQNNDSDDNNNDDSVFMKPKK
jgi:hypothetical protein